MKGRRPLCILWLSAVLSLFSTHCVSAVAPSDTSDFWILTALEPPFSQRNERGQLEDYLIELVAGILADANIGQPILAAPWERLISEAQQKANVVIFPLARTPEREDQFHWVLPLTANVYGVLGKKSPSHPISNIADLTTVSPIGVFENDFRHKLLLAENVQNVASYKDYDLAVSDLISGQLSSLFFSDAGLRYFCFKQQADCSDMKILYQYDTLTSYIALSKNTDTGHIKIMNDAAERFFKSQKFKQIQQSWLQKLRAQGPLKLHIKNGVLNLW